MNSNPCLLGKESPVARGRGPWSLSLPRAGSSGVTGPSDTKWASWLPGRYPASPESHRLCCPQHINPTRCRLAPLWGANEAEGPEPTPWRTSEWPLQSPESRGATVTTWEVWPSPTPESTGMEEIWMKADPLTAPSDCAREASAVYPGGRSPSPSSGMLQSSTPMMFPSWMTFCQGHCRADPGTGRESGKEAGTEAPKQGFPGRALRWQRWQRQDGKEVTPNISENRRTHTFTSLWLTN